MKRRFSSIDIFRERLTLKIAEGESRVVSRSLISIVRWPLLPDGGASLPKPTRQLEGTAGDAFEISPELMYTTEHEIPAVREHIVVEPRTSGSQSRRERG